MVVVIVNTLKRTVSPIACNFLPSFSAGLNFRTIPGRNLFINLHNITVNNHVAYNRLMARVYSIVDQVLLRDQ